MIIYLICKYIRYIDLKFLFLDIRDRKMFKDIFTIDKKYGFKSL